MAKEPVVIDQWQLEKLALVMQRAHVWFCTPGIPTADRQYLWGPTFEEPQQAINTLGKELGKDATVAVIPEGPYVFSQVQ
jgi:hypothetical protein